MVERKDQQGRLGLAAERILPIVGKLVRLEAVLLEESSEAIARASRITGKHDLAAGFAQRCNVARNRFIHIGLLRALWSKIAGRLDGEVDDALGLGLGERRGEMDRPLSDKPIPFGLAEVESAWLQRTIAARLRGHRAHAILVIIVDRLAP